MMSGGRGFVAMFSGKKGKKRWVVLVTQKKHKHDQQFERLVIGVLVIDVFEGAGSLLGILGCWWSRSNVGHGDGVTVLGNFVSPDHITCLWGFGKKKNQSCIGTCRWEVGQDNGTMTWHTWYQHAEQLMGSRYWFAGNVIVPMPALVLKHVHKTCPNLWSTIMLST